MKQYLFLVPLLPILMLGAVSATAWDGVEVTAADGSVERLAYGGASPTPYACAWYHDETTAPFFHITNEEALGGETCANPWLVHCDEDSLVYYGAWPLGTSYTANSIEYNVDLTCTVTVTEPVRLRAERAGDFGSLAADEHDLTLKYPDGSSLSLFWAATGPEEMQLILAPGSYEATLHVFASHYRQSGQFIRPYAGRVRLLWEDPGVVGVEPVAWSSLKALYR